MSFSFNFGSSSGPSGDAKEPQKPSAAFTFSFGGTPVPAPTPGAPQATAPLSFGVGTTAAPGNFSFGTPKAVTTSVSTGFSLGGTPSTGLGAATQATSFLSPITSAPIFSGFGAAPVQTTPAASTGFSLGAPAPNFSLGSSAATTTAVVAPSTGFNVPFTTAAPAAPSFNLLGSSPAPNVASLVSTAGFNLGSTGAPVLTLGAAPVATSAGGALAGFSLGTTTATAAAPVPSLGGTAAKVTASGFSFGSTPTTATPSLSALATSTSTAVTTTGTLTFAQLEDSINKWTIDLEEQGKLYANQAKQLNAWDRLLISNGEKILALNNGIEGVKQQQQELDQELDFILAQQKELEDLVVDLEKDLEGVQVTDVDRSNTYQLAENIDTQTKQMTEDLKEIIEQLNESNKAQESSNPITQIGKILNAHMNSLQWIDQNTTKISTHLDQIAKIHDLNRKNQEMTLQRAFQ